MLRLRQIAVTYQTQVDLRMSAGPKFVVDSRSRMDRFRTSAYAEAVTDTLAALMRMPCSTLADPRVAAEVNKRLLMIQTEIYRRIVERSLGFSFFRVSRGEKVFPTADTLPVAFLLSTPNFHIDFTAAVVQALGYSKGWPAYEPLVRQVHDARLALRDLQRCDLFKQCFVSVPRAALQFDAGVPEPEPLMLAVQAGLASVAERVNLKLAEAPEHWTSIPRANFLANVVMALHSGLLRVVLKCYPRMEAALRVVYKPMDESTQGPILYISYKEPVALQQLDERGWLRLLLAADSSMGQYFMHAEIQTSPIPDWLVSVSAAWNLPEEEIVLSGTSRQTRRLLHVYILKLLDAAPQVPSARETQIFFKLLQLDLAKGQLPEVSLFQVLEAKKRIIADARALGIYNKAQLTDMEDKLRLLDRGLKMWGSAENRVWILGYYGLRRDTVQ